MTYSGCGVADLVLQGSGCMESKARLELAPTVPYYSFVHLVEHYCSCTCVIDYSTFVRKDSSSTYCYSLKHFALTVVTYCDLHSSRFESEAGDTPLPFHNPYASAGIAGTVSAVFVD